MALKDVSFEVRDGEFLAVIGLSGSGKSTLLRCINRLIDPTSGRVVWNGQDITAANTAELRQIRRQIGMVFQHFNLVKRSSVTTNVLTGRLGYVSPLRSLFGRFSADDRRRAMAGGDHDGVQNPVRGEQLDDDDTATGHLPADLRQADGPTRPRGGVPRRSPLAVGDPLLERADVGPRRLGGDEPGMPEATDERGRLGVLGGVQGRCPV